MIFAAAAFGVGKTIAETSIETYFDEELELFIDNLYEEAEFKMGDVEKVRSLFPEDQWKNVYIEKWREDYSPLPRYTPSQNEFNDWPIEVTSYPEDQISKTKANDVVWLLTVTAEKI